MINQVEVNTQLSEGGPFQQSGFITESLSFKI